MGEFVNTNIVFRMSSPLYQRFCLFVGYLVTGLIVKNKYEPAEVESRKAMFAEKICRHLDISLREVELPKSSWDNFTK